MFQILQGKFRICSWVRAPPGLKPKFQEIPVLSVGAPSNDFYDRPRLHTPQKNQTLGLVF